MHDDWLLSVLREIEVFAATHKVTELYPQIEDGHRAARAELKPSTPIPDRPLFRCPPSDAMATIKMPAGPAQILPFRRAAGT
jgi:hypothetical protein